MREGFGGSSKIAGSISGSLCCTPFGPLHSLKTTMQRTLGGLPQRGVAGRSWAMVYFFGGFRVEGFRVLGSPGSRLGVASWELQHDRT